MTNVFIVGGSGKVARHFARQLSTRGHKARSLHRDVKQADELEALGAIPVYGDLLKLETAELAQLMTDCDVVVFSAGAGGKGGAQMTNAIDGDGLELAVAAAMAAGIRRFVLVSAFPEAGRGKAVSETFENYMAVKKRADAHLAATDLDWVILRPGTLLDTPGTGNVRAGLAIPYGGIPRADVAAALVEIIEHSGLNRIIIELTQGDTPVGSAVQQLARA